MQVNIDPSLYSSTEYSSRVRFRLSYHHRRSLSCTWYETAVGHHTTEEMTRNNNERGSPLLPPHPRLFFPPARTQQRRLFAKQDVGWETNKRGGQWIHHVRGKLLVWVYTCRCCRVMVSYSRLHFLVIFCCQYPVRDLKYLLYNLQQYITYTFH